MSLRLKIFLPLVVFVLLFISYAKLQWLPQLTAFITQQHKEQLTGHLHSVGESLIPLLLEDQLANIHGLLDSLLEDNPNWMQIELRDKDSKILYPIFSQPLPEEKNDVLVLRRSLKIYTRQIATIDVVVDISKDLENIKQLENHLFTGLLVLLIVISLAVSIMVEWIVSRPVQRLAEASNHIAKGNYTAPLPKKSSDEIGQLVGSFESMRTSLEDYNIRIKQEIEGHISAAEDLAEQKEHFAYHAAHDSLTGLINRREFESRLRVAVDRAYMDRATHTLLFIDLDKFKQLNDSCGHLAGDELLRKFSRLIEHHVREHDSVARYGGDEFAVLLEFCPLDIATRFVNDLLSDIKDFVFTWENQEHRIGASIGVAVITEHTQTIENAISAADDACYIAKENGRNCYHIHAPEQA
jgi:diguanylate cyclase (GGDEF)-like protein